MPISTPGWVFFTTTKLGAPSIDNPAAALPLCVLASLTGSLCLLPPLK
jgi:hypothetical protein